MKAIKKILVPTDLSEFSLAAVEYAASLAEMYGAKIYMLYVTDGEPNLAFPTVDRHSETIPRDSEGEAKKQLHHFVYGNVIQVRNVPEIVRVGKAQVEIPRFATEAGIDLIVMATHGRTGFAHVLMGSVAEKVVRTSSVPVMTIKPRELQSVLVTEEDIEKDLHLKG